jgi:hypothetical protein
MDYSATDKHKTVLIRHNYTNSIVSMAAGRWASTAAVHTVALTKTSLSFASGSVISLYGIEA